MFDYRALYEIQPSVSVDFLRVVQLTQSAFLKGSYSTENVDIDPLFIQNDAISLTFDRLYWH